MRRLARIFLGLSAIFAVGAYELIMVPDVPEMIIEEGEPLLITCRSQDDIELYYPESDESLGIETSEHRITKEDVGKNKISKFSRIRTVSSDTGWYGCTGYDIGNDTDLHGQNGPKAKWTYVYVKSESNFFVPTADWIVRNEIVNQEVIIPCRVTHPNLQVEFHYMDNSSKVEHDYRYDPKKGVITKFFGIPQAGGYKCVAGPEAERQEVSFYIHLNVINVLSHPRIDAGSIQHVVEGQAMKIVCLIHVGHGTRCGFRWTVPRPEVDKQLEYKEETLGQNSRNLRSELTIENVSYDDEGEYTCHVTDCGGIPSASRYVNVKAPTEAYLNLNYTGDSVFRVKEASRTEIQWAVPIHSHPEVKIMWVTPNGDEISPKKWTWTSSNTQAKYAIKLPEIGSEYQETALKIRNVRFDDMGVYTLKASNARKPDQNLNFTLEVETGAMANLRSSPKAYHRLHRPYTFLCEGVGFPAPNVSWSLQKCPEYPETASCSSADLANSSSTLVGPTKADSEVSLKIQMSGLITCTACNAIKCDSVTDVILATDINVEEAEGSGVVVTASPEKVTSEDEVTFTCSASIYNYTNIIKWLNETNYPIWESNRIKITSNTTGFTHRSYLTIRNLKKSDQGDYICRVRNVDNDEVTVSRTLALQTPSAPFFMPPTNLNQSMILVIPETDRPKSVKLKCFANGMPAPEILWYKDDELLRPNDQFVMHEKRNQVLEIKFFRSHKDSAKYKCVARSHKGVNARYQEISVTPSRLPRFVISTGVVLILILLGLSMFFYRRSRRERQMRKQLCDAGLLYFSKGDVECINPNQTLDDQASLLPYDRKWEFPKDRLRLGKQLGAGAFGVVMKGQARGIRTDESVTTVAIKMVRRDADPTYVGALASELKIMIHLGKHLNVVNLLGACTENIAKRELLVIVEYCRFGSLDKYLLRNRKTFIDQIDPETGKINPSIGSELMTRSSSLDSNNRLRYAALSFSGITDSGTGPGTESVTYTTDNQELNGLPDTNFTSNGSQPAWRSNYRGDYRDQNVDPICTQDLLSWAFQVARGMEYLCQRKVLHGDLAARNILLAENNVVKICDFGLAKSMYKNDNYMKQGDGPLPIKWMAIESIRDRIFSTQSDVWAFGVVLWEFFTLAGVPYPGMQAEKLFEKLIDGYRMEQPKYATNEIYEVMFHCWKVNPKSRPTFTELVESLGNFLEEAVRMHYVDLNAPYSDFNMEEMKYKEDYLHMMSAPDHDTIISMPHDYENAPSGTSESRYVNMSPKSGSPNNNHSDSDESPESVPMLGKVRKSSERSDQLDEDNYLKPIDVRKKREEFVRKREEEKKKEKEKGQDRDSGDSGYCNTPKLAEMLEIKALVNGVDAVDGNTGNKFFNQIQGSNYVNVPEKEAPSSFMNPSYVFVEGKKTDRDSMV